MRENGIKKNSQDHVSFSFLDEMTVPVRNASVTIREEMEEDGKYILFNAENELLLVTNPAGKFILDKCNGEKNVAQIIKDIENEFTVKEDIALPAVVKEYVSTLLKVELVTIKEGQK